MDFIIWSEGIFGFYLCVCVCFFLFFLKVSYFTLKKIMIERMAG